MNAAVTKLDIQQIHVSTRRALHTYCLIYKFTELENQNNK